MQFTAILALAVGASAMVVQRQNETIATIDVYNFSTCDVDSVASYEITADSNCVNFEVGYGSASYELASGGDDMLRKFFLFFYFFIFAFLPLSTTTTSLF